MDSRLGLVGTRLRLAWLRWVMMCPSAIGQTSDVHALLDRIALDASTATDSNENPGARMRSADDAILHRDQLILLGERDRRLAIWMTDQAAALLDRVSRQGADTELL